MPLFEAGQRRGAKVERRSEVDAVRAERLQAEREARAEVRTALEAVRSTERALAAARMAAAQAAEVVQITDTAFREGATTNIEVLDAQRLARDADTAAALAETDVTRARLEVLVAALGRLALERALHALELHRELRTVDPHVRHALQLACETEPRQRRDQPFRRVVLPPAHAVAVVVLKDVMEVVIALAIGEKRERAVVARGVLVGVRLRAPHVGERVDAGGAVEEEGGADEEPPDQHLPAAGAEARGVDL